MMAQSPNLALVFLALTCLCNRMACAGAATDMPPTPGVSQCDSFVKPDDSLSSSTACEGENGLNQLAFSKMEEDADALQMLSRYSNKRVVNITANRTNLHVSTEPVTPEPALNKRNIPPAPTTEEEVILSRVRSSMQDMRKATPSHEINYYRPIWNRSNAQNTSLDCSQVECMLVLQQLSTNWTWTITLDANGKIAGHPSGSDNIYGGDTKKVQVILQALSHVHALVDKYNAEVCRLGQGGEGPPPQLNFFIEVVNYNAGVIFPRWPWNYNVRAYLKLSMYDAIPPSGLSFVVDGYSGNSALGESLVPFLWKRDDEKLPIGHKKVFATKFTWDPRSPINTMFTDNHATLMECFFRTYQLMLYLEDHEALSGLPLWQFMDVKTPLLKEDGTCNNKPHSCKKMSFVWTANFPAAVQFRLR